MIILPRTTSNAVLDLAKFVEYELSLTDRQYKFNSYTDSSGYLLANLKIFLPNF